MVSNDNKLKIATIVGTRPEFIRLSVMIKKFDKYFLLESFKHKDYHIDASNISTLNYDINC